MKLSVRVLLGFFLIVGLAVFFLLHTFTQEVKPGVRQGMEVTLVDTANVLAELAAEDMKSARIESGPFSQAVERFRKRHPRAHIWGMAKGAVDFRIYVTDARGTVVFDSQGEAMGQDYSRWNDVYLTLRGQYGARSSPEKPHPDAPSVMHVAAPVMDGEKIIGVLTVANPTSSVVPYAERSERRVFHAGLLLVGSALVIGIGLSWWLTLAIGKLRTYARDVSEGRKAVRPEVGGTELDELGRALETMREKLEGRQYVERYVHTLTHEMKSPLSAIRGAAELLEEDMPEGDRQRFVSNIREHEERLRQLIERMLNLATVEHRQNLQDPVDLSLAELVKAVVSSRRTLCDSRTIRVESSVPEDACVHGESFLLEQAFANLLDNALAFSPEGARIIIALETDARWHVLVVQDEGSGIPEYAMEKLFEPFYSLPRPDTHKKSTGLGLSFVREVAELHGGRITLANRAEGGVEARLELPSV